MFGDRDLSSAASTSFIQAANAAVSRMMGLPWTGLGRAADLAWFLFGETIGWRNYKGEIVERSAFALHVQCPFRITLGTRLLLGSPDLYEPLSDVQPPAATQANKNRNLFDLRASELRAGRLLSAVTSAAVSDFGDVTLTCESGLRLETFAASTAEDESWRILGFIDPEFNFVFPED